MPMKPMKSIKNNLLGRLMLLVFLLAVAGCGAVAGAPAVVVPTVHAVDSLSPASDRDTSSYEIPRPRHFNALRFTLDAPHRYRGDTLTEGYTFMSFGTGAMMQYHANKGGAELLPMLHLRVGRAFSPLHAARLGLTLGMGYLRGGAAGEGPWTLTSHVGAEVDYLFNFSNYLAGYRPERPLSVSLLLGVGLGSYRLAGSGKSTAQHLQDHAFSYQLHSGLQLRLFAGPHAALTAEPYVQLGNAASDLSGTTANNWHRYTVNWGVNLSYVYYLRNVLSPASKTGDFMRKKTNEERWLRGDADDQLQRRPLFVSYGLGATGYTTFGHLKLGTTLGPSYSLGFGGWLSSALGLQLSATLTNASLTDSKTRTNKLGYAAMAVDALLNPLGFTRHYDWDARAGVHLVAGLEYGLMKRTEDRQSSSNMMGVRLGVHPWLRLCHQTRFFIEPMYAVLVHRRGNYMRANDRQVSLKAGIEMMLGHRKEEPYHLVNGPLPQGVFVGAGGGWNTSFERYRIKGAGNGLFKNAVMFAGYRLNALSSFMLSGEYLTERYKQGSRRDKWEYWMTSADYLLNLSNWLTGYQEERRWNVHAMAGPTVAIHSGPLRMGVHVGLQVDCRVYSRFALFFQQRLYWMGKAFYGSAGHLFKPMGTLVNTLNVGVMYQF